VYSSLASLRLEHSLLLNFFSGHTVDTLAVAGWAPAAFGVGHVRGDVYTGKVRMHGVKKRPYYVFVLISYASDVSQLRTALRNQWFTVPCHASRRRGRVTREGMSPGPYTLHRAHIPQSENIPVRKPLYYSVPVYMGLYRYRPALLTALMSSRLADGWASGAFSISHSITRFPAPSSASPLDSDMLS
jgi:hypothetical protein